MWQLRSYAICTFVLHTLSTLRCTDSDNVGRIGKILSARVVFDRLKSIRPSMFLKICRNESGLFLKILSFFLLHLGLTTERTPGISLHGGQKFIANYREL